MIVYIAGASAELERAARMMDLARKAGFEIAHDWVADIRQAGDANPAADARKYADADVSGVRHADVFWLLMPAVATSGAWLEYGLALAKNGYTLISGPGREASIFTSLATETADTDEEGLATLCAYRERAHGLRRYV